MVEWVNISWCCGCCSEKLSWKLWDECLVIIYVCNAYQLLFIWQGTTFLPEKFQLRLETLETWNICIWVSMNMILSDPQNNWSGWICISIFKKVWFGFERTNFWSAWFCFVFTLTVNNQLTGSIPSQIKVLNTGFYGKKMILLAMFFYEVLFFHLFNFQ